MNWWEDLKLMRRLYRYDADSGLIYACDRLPGDFYDTGEGSSFKSAAGSAAKYNKDTSGRLSFNRRVRERRSTCDYLCGGGLCLILDTASILLSSVQTSVAI